MGIPALNAQRQQKHTVLHIFRSLRCFRWACLEVQASIQPQNAQKKYKYHSCASFAGENNSTCFAPAGSTVQTCLWTTCIAGFVGRIIRCFKGIFSDYAPSVPRDVWRILGQFSLAWSLGRFGWVLGTTRQALLMKNMLNCGITLSSRIALCSRDT